MQEYIDKWNEVLKDMESEDKLYLLVDSLKLLTDTLTEKDTVSLVTYASADRVVFEGLKGNQTEEILAALDELTAYGSTNGEGGINRAYDIAEKYKENEIVINELIGQLKLCMAII